MTSSTPVPGWYPDPSDAGVIRWWDGSAWTPHTQALETVSAAAPTAAEGSATAMVAAPAAAPPLTIAPDGFLLPDPQATPGRRADPPPARRALTDAPIATSGNEVALSRRELRRRESAATNTNSAPQDSAPRDSAPQASAPQAPAGEQLPPVTAAPPPSPAPTVAPPGAAANAPAATPTATASASASASAFRPEVLPRMSASTGPVAVDDRFADLFGDTPSHDPTPAPAPPAAPAEARSEPVPDFSDPIPVAETRPAVPAPAATAVADAPRASDASTTDEQDETFAVPWVSVAGEAVPLSAVELASVDYEPLPPSRGGQTRSLPTIPSTSVTASSWMLALSPLLAIGAAVGGVLLAAALGFSAAVTAPPTLIVGTPSVVSATLFGVLADPVGGLIAGAAVLLMALLVIVWAVLDRRALGRLGFADRPSAVWIILGPFVYLIARAVATARAGRTGAAPLWTHVVLVVALIAAAGAAPFLVPRQATITDLRAVEQSIASDLAAQNVAVSVLCPDSADARIGSTFVCDALDTDGTLVGLITVRWTGADGSIEYQIELGDASAG